MITKKKKKKLSKENCSENNTKSTHSSWISWIEVRCLSAAPHHGLLLPFHLLTISLAPVRPVLLCVVQTVAGTLHRVMAQLPEDHAPFPRLHAEGAVGCWAAGEQGCVVMGGAAQVTDARRWVKISGHWQAHRATCRPHRMNWASSLSRVRVSVCYQSAAARSRQARGESRTRPRGARHVRSTL